MPGYGPIAERAAAALRLSAEMQLRTCTGRKNGFLRGAILLDCDHVYFQYRRVPITLRCGNRDDRSQSHDRTSRITTPSVESPSQQPPTKTSSRPGRVGRGVTWPRPPPSSRAFRHPDLLLSRMRLRYNRRLCARTDATGASAQLWVGPRFRPRRSVGLAADDAERELCRLRRRGCGAAAPAYQVDQHGCGGARHV